MAKNNINEELSRFNSLLGYNPKVGTQLNERIGPNRNEYRESINEEETEEEFDFGEEGSPEEGEDAATAEEGGDFDFGDEGSPEDEEPAEGEDEFGTASEFSAADDLEGAEDEEVEEIDVTSIVKGSDEAKEMAQQAVTVGQENSSYLKALTDKLSNLESQLSKMDTIANKLGKLEQDIKTPEEKLELRSLDSFPFNQKLSDYWEDKAKTDDRYRISTGEENSDGDKKEYVLTPEEVEDSYSEEAVKKSFVPESYNSKKKIIKEQQLLNEGLSGIFKKFRNRKEEIKDQLSDEFGIEEGDDKETIGRKIENVVGNNPSESKIKMLAKKIGGALGSLMLTILTLYTTFKAVSASPLGHEGDIISFLGYGITSYVLYTFRDSFKKGDTKI